MENIENSALETMVKICQNPDMKKGIKAALEFIKSSGYYNWDDWFSMSNEEMIAEVSNYMDENDLTEEAKECIKRVEEHE